MWFTDLLGCHGMFLIMTVLPQWRHLLANSKDSKATKVAAALATLLVILVEEVTELVLEVLLVATEIEDVFCTG